MSTESAETSSSKTPGTETPLATPLMTPAETPSERYLRQIRNVIVAAFVIWIAGALVASVVWLAVSAHDRTLARERACANSGGIWVNGQCV